MYCHDLRIYYERRLSKGHYLSPLQLLFTRGYTYHDPVFGKDIMVYPLIKILVNS